MSKMCGGTGAVKEADSTVQELCDQVKAELEQRHGQQFDIFVAVSYKTQLVNGTNYFVKLRVGEEEYYHVRIHKALPHEQGKVTLSTSEIGKTKEEEISYI